MSFLRPDNKPDQNYDAAAQATVDPFATPPPAPVTNDDNTQDDGGQTPPDPIDPSQASVPSDQADNDQQSNDFKDNNDVTVTTNEGSTLHTFNDPTLQNAVTQDAPVVDSSNDGNEDNEEGDNMPSGLPVDSNDTASSVNDALSFQDHDGTALTSFGDTNETTNDTENSASEEATQDTMPSEDTSQPVTSEEPSLTTDASSSELDGIKKQALEQLRPLLEKVDLPAGEKFDKYLMMLRATDDPTLIEPAFNAAQGITEDKDKAEALVDIINEINYVSGGEQADEKPSL